MSVVGSWWVGGSVVGGSVEHLSVGRWAVVGGLSVVGGFVIRLIGSMNYSF